MLVLSAVLATGPYELWQALLKASAKESAPVRVQLWLWALYKNSNRWYLLPSTHPPALRRWLNSKVPEYPSGVICVSDSDLLLNL